MKVLFQIGPSEACVREVADKLNMSESAVSHHIHILRMNGFVRWRRSGNKYFVDLQHHMATRAASLREQRQHMYRICACRKTSQKNQSDWNVHRN